MTDSTKQLTEEDLNTRRLRSCVEAWPEAFSGDYNPYCCRFPKSCSPHAHIEAYYAGNLTEDDLEPEKNNVEQHKVPWDIDRNMPLAESLKLDCIECGKEIAVQIFKNSGWCSAKCMKKIARLAGIEDATPEEIKSLVGDAHFVIINDARRALGMPLLVIDGRADFGLMPKEN